MPDFRLPPSAFFVVRLDGLPFTFCPLPSPTRLLGLMTDDSDPFTRVRPPHLPSSVLGTVARAS